MKEPKIEGASPEKEPSEKDSQEKELREKILKIKTERELVEARDPIKLLERQLRDEEIALENARVIAKAEEELGERDLEFTTLETPEGVIILKRSDSPRMRQFMDLKSVTSTACENLVRPNIHHPSPDTVDKWFVLWPQLILEAANLLVLLSKGEAKRKEGK